MLSKTSKDKFFNLRKQIYHIIYYADTPAAKWFDILLIISIVLSVTIMMLDSIVRFNLLYGGYFYKAEWFFTILFSIEYLFRIVSHDRPLKYLFSFYGIVDFLAIVPTYLSLLVSGAQYLMVVRVLRILRIFRVLKLMRHVRQANTLVHALLAGGTKLTVFLFFILTIIILFGSTLYLVEGPENGFTSIPRSIYWAIITLTTVGYGDITPKTDLGQAIASIVMIIGYAIIAVPTGIFTAELSQAIKQETEERACPTCHTKRHFSNAKHCHQCGGLI